MKQRGLIVLILVAVIGLPAAAQEQGSFGLGAVFGEPTGITAKQYVSSHIAFDATIYWSFVANDTLYAHLDYLHHTDTLFGQSPDGFTFYGGIGGMIQFSANPALGVRVPLGINYFLTDMPLEFFFEIGPLLLLYPETTAGATAGLGVRYYF
jgi:hypothetical protein